MINDQDMSATFDKISQEFRRGLLILATLSQLKEERYGYALMDELASQGLEIDQGTLYPLLRRLEAQGLLDSSWDTSGSRPRRYYVINETGKALMKELTSEWQTLTRVMTRLLARDS